MPTRATTAIRDSELRDAEDDLYSRVEIDTIEPSRKPRMSDLWNNAQDACSYWILVMSGIDQHDEMDIALQLLQWGHFTARESAGVLCIPSSDRRRYRVVTTHFEISRYPTLILSDSKDMRTALNFDSKLLEKLIEDRGAFRRLLTELHTLIERAVALHDIASRLEKEEVIRKLKSVYSEFKSLISITVQTKTEF